MAFSDRRWPDGRIEAWFTGGPTSVGAFRLGPRETLGTVDLPGWLGDSGVQDLEIVGIARSWRQDECHAWFSAREPGGQWRIFHTSRLVGSPWSPSEPVLCPTLDTDREHVLLPTVVEIDGGWRMWYVGRDGSRRRIHLATSPDGVNWTKHGVAVDVGEPGDCDAYAADCPAVVNLSSSLLMFYGAGSSRSIAAAISEDGEKWRRLGPVLHRSTSAGPTGEYAFYPAVAADGDRGRLVFAGEDSSHRWRLMATRPFSLSGLIERRIPIAVPADVTANWRSHRDKLDRSHLEETADAFGAAPAYRSEDGAVEQVRPSSTAVLRVASARDGQFAVKLGRSSEGIQAEYDAMSWLAGWYNVAPANLQYTDDGQPYLVTPWLGESLAMRAEQDPSSTLQYLAEFLADLGRAVRQAVPVHEVGEVDWPPQTLPLLRRWLDDAVRLLERQVDAVHPGGPSLEALCHRATRSLRLETQWVSPSSADHHLHNMLVHRGRYALIDLEFGGMIDVDYSAAKIVASILKHTGAANSYPPAGPFAGLTSLAWWRTQLSSDKLRWERVLGFVLAKLIFRLRTHHQSGQGVLPAVGVLADMMDATEGDTCWNDTRRSSST